VEDHAGHDVPHWMQAELEAGHDAEVPALTTDAPEQIGVLGLAGMD
jgi:hypothetical protein